jgi:hypothetical protein
LTIVNKCVILVQVKQTTTTRRYKMLQSNNTLTASQIKSLNLTFNTWLAMEFDNGKYFLLADMKRIAVFSTRKAQLNTFNKARRMLIGYGGNNINEGLNGEERGLEAAAQIGENAFASIIITDGKSI